MAERNGREIIVKHGSNVVGSITSMTLNGNQTTLETSSKSSGVWVTRIPDRKDWSIEVTVLIDDADSNGQRAVVADWLSGDSASYSFGKATPATGDITYTGTAHVTSLSRTEDDGAVSTMTITLEGTGALTENVAA